MKKKKTYFILIFLAFIVTTFSCSKNNPGNTVDDGWHAENGKIKVLSTIAMIDNVVSEIGGDRIDHMCLIVGEIDPHSYELVKGDDEKITRADLVFFNGLGLEHGASLKYHLDTHKAALGVGDYLLATANEKLLFNDGQIDPHIWMDMELFSLIIDPIVDALVKKDPEQATFFRSNGEILKNKILESDRILYAKMQSIPQEKRYLITSHDAFNYFTKRYLAAPGELDGKWKMRCSAPEGLAPDGQMSVLDIQRVCNFLCEHRISFVFPESNVSRHSLKKIVSVCLEKGHNVKVAETPLYGDTMGSKTYIQMIEYNIETLFYYFSEA